MAPVIKALSKKKIQHVFVTTGQHYDFLLFDKIIDDLGLPKPDYNLTIGSGTPGLQIGIGMLVIERVLDKEEPNIVLAQGDTNSVFAAAIAAHRNGYLFGHIEAGLRSYDMTMPEESNRILTDHISNILFAPTELSKSNLTKENIEKKRIIVTGNTVVDAVFQNIPIAKKKSDIMKKLSLTPRSYILGTYHRAENTTKENLLRLIDILNKLSKKDQKIVIPLHPRTIEILKINNMLSRLNNIKNLMTTEALGYLDFLLLMKNAKLLLTDSGGLQEESMVLKVPTLVLRYNTERPEALGKGCKLVGLDKDLIMKLVDKPPKVSDKCPFGDGKAGEKITDFLKNIDLEKYRFTSSPNL
jgi:UDP-N-acetylglucosamine 2-epimerase (non-hydrolysing)